MKTLRIFLALTLLLASASVARSTTVIPPTFDELVSEAQLIFQGSVTGVRSEWLGEGAQRRIVSYITFNVEDAIKGQPGASYTMRMLGGTVEGRTMEVTDSPKFKVGDRDIVFIENNGTQFIPLVGIMHGRFRVQKDQQSGREIVARNSGQPVTDLTVLGTGGQTSAKAALSPLDFKTAVKTSIQKAEAKAHLE